MITMNMSQIKAWFSIVTVLLWTAIPSVIKTIISMLPPIAIKKNKKFILLLFDTEKKKKKLMTLHNKRKKITLAWVLDCPIDFSIVAPFPSDLAQSNHAAAPFPVLQHNHIVHYRQHCPMPVYCTIFPILL